MGRFDDKVAWITGGGTGIGKEMALEFAREGADVAVSGRRMEPLEAVCGEVKALGRRALAVVCDVADDAAVGAAVREVVDGLGKLDVAVANAGYGVMAPFEEISDAQFRRQYEVNVFGAASTARHALPELRRTDGRLALVASVAAFTVGPKSSAYSSSKFALRGLGLAISQDIHGSGVSCTTLHPGFVASDIHKIDNDGGVHEDWKDRRPGKLIWPTDKAARVMVRAIHKRKREHVFTGHGHVLAWVGKHTPSLVHFALTRGGSKK